MIFNSHNGKRQLLVLIIMGVHLLLLLGCNWIRPNPPLAVVTVTMTPTKDVASDIDPTIEKVLTIQATLTPHTPEPTVTIMPEAAVNSSSCAFPETWVSYTIHAGDTLFRLAIVTNTTVEEIKEANCKIIDDLAIGEILYLPSTPPLLPQTDNLPPSNPTPPTQTLCSPFNSCPAPDPELSALLLPHGGPNDPTFVPCPTPQPGFPTQMLSVPPGSDSHEIGDRAFFFACNFTEPSLIKAQMVGPNNYVQELIVQTEISNPDLKMGAAQRVIQWDPICNLELGIYTITLDDQQGNPVSFSFNLSEPSYEKILTVPQAAAPGAEFDVYFCGYDDVGGKSINVDLFYEKMIEEDGDYILDPSTSFVVPITEEGWGKLSIRSFETDIPRAYGWEDNDLNLEGEDLFWLRVPEKEA